MILAVWAVLTALSFVSVPLLVWWGIESGLRFEAAALMLLILIVYLAFVLGVVAPSLP